MHMPPANPQVAETLGRVKNDPCIQLSGQPVRVDGQDAYRWSSSLSHDDTGAACELIRVEQLRLLN